MDVGRRAFLLGRTSPRALRAGIGDGCLARQGVTCRTCGERCETGAILFSLCPGGVAIPQISTDACNGCGECIADCPSGAIGLLPLISDEGIPA